MTLERVLPMHCWAGSLFVASGAAMHLPGLHVTMVAASLSLYWLVLLQKHDSGTRKL